MDKIARLLLWGGGVCLVMAGCGNDYLFFGLEEPQPPAGVDILFVVDDSPSMADEQLKLAQSLDKFFWVLEEEFGQVDFRLAVTTTSVKSSDCPANHEGCFSNLLGKYPLDDPSQFNAVRNPTCRVVTPANLDCLYNEGTGRGTLLAGNQGNGYRHGLSAMRRALFYESDFLRPDASLVVVLVSDGEDCGEPGEIDQGGFDPGPLACYQAAAGGGSGPLTGAQEYYGFLMDLKGWQAGMVKFAALTGIRDSDDPLSTTIEFVDDEVLDACVTPGCLGDHCQVGPGTRAVELADKFGLGKNGMVDTLCRRNLTKSMYELGGFSACPTVFMLREPLWNPGQAEILVNDEPVPRFSCNLPGELRECQKPQEACGSGLCVETWIYRVPTAKDSLAPGGTIRFADHFNPCHHFGGPLRVQVVDPVP